MIPRCLCCLPLCSCPSLAPRLRLTDPSLALSASPLHTAMPMWIQRGTFAWPPLETPTVLIGPGTGCAPFRSYLHQRIVQGATGEKHPRGCARFSSVYRVTETGDPRSGPPSLPHQHQTHRRVLVGQKTTFSSATATWHQISCTARNGKRFRRKESCVSSLRLAEIRSDNCCTAKAADDGLSRSHTHTQLQEEKVYVQHRMMEQAPLLWALLSQRNAFVFIAG